MDISEYYSSSSELKRSCEECSSSKIKCSQDKPVCKRCRKQGIACTYAPPKRTGRPRKIRKDSDHSQPRTIRPLASAVSRSADADPPSMEENFPLSVYSVEQEMHSHRLDDLDMESSSGLNVAGYATGNTGNIEVAHSDMECHLVDHDWPTNAQDLETLWGTPLHQQPYIDGGFGSGNYLSNHGIIEENLSAMHGTWKGQHKSFRRAGVQPAYMYIDFQGGEVESGQLSVYSQDADFGTW